MFFQNYFELLLLIIIRFKFYIFTKKRRLKREKRELALRRLHTFDQGSIFFNFLESRDYCHQPFGNKGAYGKNSKYL